MDDPIIITGFQRSGTTAVTYALYKSFPNIINESGIMKMAIDHLLSLDSNFKEHISWRFGVDEDSLNWAPASYIKSLYTQLIDSKVHSLKFTKDYPNQPETTIIDEKPLEPGYWHYWGDKITNAGKIIPLIKEIFPESKIIYVVREPLEVIASNLRLNWFPDEESAWNLWMQEAVEYYKWKKDIPHLIIRQKELLNFPQNVAGQMTEFLGHQFLEGDFGSFVYKGDKPERKTTNPSDYNLTIPSKMVAMVQMMRSL